MPVVHAIIFAMIPIREQAGLIFAVSLDSGSRSVIPLLLVIGRDFRMALQELAKLLSSRGKIRVVLALHGHYDALIFLGWL